MGTSSDATSGAPLSSGIAARRQHSSLPSFQLPANHRSYTNLGSVLTPPSLGAGDSGHPMSSSMTNSGSNATAGSAAYSSSTLGYWPASNSPPYSYGAQSGGNQSYTSAPSHSQNYPLRNMYAPGGNAPVNRNNSRPSSPTASSLVGSSAYEPTPPYATSMQMTTHSSQPVSSGGLPPIGQGSIHQQYSTAYSVSGAPPQSPIHAHSQGSQDPYSPHSSLPPPTPSHSYYQQNSQYTTSPPVPHGLAMSSSQHSSMNRPLIASGSSSSPPYPHHPPIHPAPPHVNLQQRYPLPHMGMSVPYPGIGLHHTTLQQQERPFKCDQCPQSFNRNHDLKRHKRIHLAVKPFPCDNCEKSFSRKDALKVTTPN